MSVQFFVQICQGSVEAELIYRNHRAEKHSDVPVVLASSITSFLLLTFVRFHAENFSNFSHSLSTAAFASGIFIAWGIGINLCTKL